MLLTDPEQDTLKRSFERWIEEDLSEQRRVKIEDLDFIGLRDQFEALGLIRVTSAETPAGHNEFHWNITEKGRRFGILNRAVKRETKPQTP